MYKTKHLSVSITLMFREQTYSEFKFYHWLTIIHFREKGYSISG